MKNKFYWFYLSGFFLILSLPLLNLPPWFSPPDWGKTIVFRIVFSILFFLFIYQVLKGQFSIKLDRKTRLGFWSLIALVLVFFLATLFSLDPYFSFWGSPYRSGGFLNFSFYILFALLAFLIFKKEHWQKIWDFAIFIGILVSIIAIFQLYGILGKFLVTFSGRPASTVGGPIFLAIYLLLLTFLSLSFGIKTKNLFKKIFYFLSFLLFLFVIILVSQTRAAMVGLGIGFFYLIFFWPSQKKSISLVLKISALSFLILGICLIYLANIQPPNWQTKFISENQLLKSALARLSVRQALNDPRISGWKVGFKAFKAKPILGYGPENFLIGFDKFYDPALPKIEETAGGVISWWDRAHNFILDIGITTGILGLITYLFLFGILFFQLQKFKKQSKSVIAHGLQAGFLAYLGANFFSFDTFSTYLISFLLIGYSLHLISEHRRSLIPKFSNKMSLNKKITISLLFLFLIWFVYFFNIKPFRVNTQINIAKYLVQNNQCQQAFIRMDNALKEKTFLDSYLRLKYADFIKKCQLKHPEKTLSYTKKGVELFKENIKIQPCYTRNWLLLGSYINILAEKESNPETKEELIKQANHYLEKAHQLSPKRQAVFIEWAITDLISGQYQKAKEKAQKCIDLNEKLGNCYWLKGLSEIYLGNFEKAKENIKMAKSKKYPIDSLFSLGQMAKAYTASQNYSELAKVYQKLIKIKPKELQYYASLAAIYKKIGRIEMAKKQALKILEIEPKFKKEVEKFLKGLK